MKISDNVLQVLDAATFTGNAMSLTGQLDPKMYAQTKKIIEAAGGKWNRSAQVHLFPGDAAEAIEPIILTGEVIKPQDFGFFPTSDAVIDRMLAKVKLDKEMFALEPSAGTGAIARRLVGLVDKIDCIELLDKNVEVLQTIPGIAAKQGDFLEWAPVACFDVIVMNPPFAKQADIRHVVHALEFLRPGGQLVSVMSAGVMFRENWLTKHFRMLVEERDGTIEALPDGSFKDAGTQVNTCLVTLTA